MASGPGESGFKQYMLITTNYWTFTLTDGALRMLVVLHFHDLGYSPLSIAFLFLFYEIFGVVTNLVGGWIGARLGLNHTMNAGLALQIGALCMLLVPPAYLTISWVMIAQALSGIAKDLNKMSAKSAVKFMVPSSAEDKLFKLVALLTGSKNALKGVGFFLGGLLLSIFGFSSALSIMIAALLIVLTISLIFLKKGLGQAKSKPKFRDIFSKSDAINKLSAARLFLFGARDVWFVVALPVYLSATLEWSHWSVSGFLALWIIGYGLVQTFAPYLTRRSSNMPPDGKTALIWVLILSITPFLIALTLYLDFQVEASLIVGLLMFGFLFAINSSLHSYLILSYADRERVSLDVGFYYMANAMGRLLGTILSGWAFQLYGLTMCLIISGLFLLLASGISFYLPSSSHKPLSPPKQPQ
ncbi:MAG: organoarsenical effux MFS transporter ArsJ [Sneathiella sp.]|nr:organoarsenical effux MFS transporter ArsJ [Sneathiella sp.]